MTKSTEWQHVAGNGLLSRRHLLGLGLSSASVLASSAVLGADGKTLFEIPDWSRQAGPGPSGYGQRSAHTAFMQRDAGATDPLYPGGGASRSPLQHLQGTITPNSLHFERHHAGIPAIDPAGHQLVINGLVKQALAFSYESLLSYPMVSRFYFLECSGNSRSLYGARPGNGTAQTIHGLLSGAEWTGIPLSTLLDEAGILGSAQWVSAVGADAASMGRSVPLNKALDDVLVALYQNGEPLRPEQGYPMRLFVPGWEGNISVKWLTQLKLTQEPSQFRDETSKYTDTLADKTSLQFTFPMGCKSVITSPSGQMQLRRHGLYQITGVAWSGNGTITRVEVSADGGQTWAEAMLDSAQHAKALTRFRIPWSWDGATAQLMSRATDSTGAVQPTRTALLAERGENSFYHCNAIQCWGVSAAGDVTNVYV